MQCPKCGAENSGATPFCTRCQQILFDRCPNCRHVQPHADKCEKCGTNLVAYWEAALMEAGRDEERKETEQIKSMLRFAGDVVLLPFVGLRGLLRGVILRLLSGRVSRR